MIHHGFATEADCRAVIAAFRRLQAEHALAIGDPYWDQRVIHAPAFRAHEPMAADILQSWRRRSTLLVEAMASDVLYADNVHVVRWPPGMAMSPHQDDRHPDGSPHNTPWRAWAGVIYLNDDYEGGELYFPERPELDYGPEIGDFACFPGHWWHGVREVRGGERYTAPNWYTPDRSHEDLSS